MLKDAHKFQLWLESGVCIQRPFRSTGENLTTDDGLAPVQAVSYSPLDKHPAGGYQDGVSGFGMCAEGLNFSHIYFSHALVDVEAATQRIHVFRP